VIYLDNSATTFAAPQVISAVTEYMLHGDFNPSSLHAGGVSAWSRLSELRKQISESVSSTACQYDVIFTSGGTESNNLALLGYAHKARKPAVFLISLAEHPSVLKLREPLEKLGAEVRLIPLEKDGQVSLEFIKKNIGDASLISVTQVASETGAVNPLREIVKLRDNLAPNCKIHSDGSQGFLRVSKTLQGVDMYTISGHKIHAPKGIAALALRRVALASATYGGLQENSLRAGTENMPGIVGLAEAISLPIWNDMDSVRRRKIHLYESIKEKIQGIQVNGADPLCGYSAPHILNISLPNILGEVFVRALSAEGVYVGTGSACSSKQAKRKEIYESMGIPQERQKRAVRISLSPYTTDEDVREAAKSFVKTYRSLAI
jgi:cysteine desulfurase